MYERIGHWTSLITRWVGLGLIGYEVLLDGFMHPSVIAFGTTLSLAGVATDFVRTGGA